MITSEINKSRRKVMNQLTNKKIAILATDGYEESELEKPFKALKNEGAQVHIISIKKDPIKAWSNGNWSSEHKVDLTLNDANPNEYDGLLLPGGVINPDKLRRDKKAVEFVSSFFKSDVQKPVAAICHGPWTLVEADVLKGRKVTSYDSIKTDLKNAGAHWVDKEVVVDKGLVTSRSPEDLDAFIGKMIEEYKEGKHDRK